MSNWLYAQDVPTTPWRSEMSIPRALSLRMTPAGLRLVQQPVKELGVMRKTAVQSFSGGSVAAANAWLATQKALPPLLDIEMAFAVTTATVPFTVSLTTAPGEQTDITIDPTKQQLTLDRTRSGKSDFYKGFAARHVAPLRIGADGVDVRLLLDASSLELFAQRGETVLTDLLFPTGSARVLSIAEPAATTARIVSSIRIHPLTMPRTAARAARTKAAR
jgi:fructan beta-fructosidase